MEAGIEPAFWLGGGTLAEMCARLVEEALRQKKVNQLVCGVAVEYPELIN